MIPPLSICLRSAPPGWFDDTNIHNIHIYIYIHEGIRLPYLPGPARTSTKWRGRPYRDNERINACIEQPSYEVPTACRVFSIRKAWSGPRLLPTAIWNPLGVHAVLRYSVSSHSVETRDGAWTHEIWGFWTRSSRVEYVYSFIMV